MINLPVFAPEAYKQDPMGGIGGLLQQALAQFNQQRQSNDQHELHKQALQEALIRSQFMPQQLQQQLQQGDLANKLAEVNLGYAPQKNEATIKNLNTLSDYRLSPSAIERGLSPLGKSILEQNQLSGNNPELSQAYDAARQKLTSDLSTRQKSLYAQNIDKTLSRMPEDVINNYSGLEGHARLAKDFLQSQTGKPSEEYKQFSKFAQTDAPILAGQIRQFYGESVQPSVRHELENLSNPIYWTTHPDVAMAKFEELINLLHSEADTYNKALNNPISASQRSNDIGSISAEEARAELERRRSKGTR